MGYFTYLTQADNLIVDATLTPDTENSSYPIENAQAEPIAKTFRSESSADEKILIDFAGEVTVDLFAIVNHSFTDAAVVTLRGGSSQDPDGMDFELIIPWKTRNSWALFDAEVWQYWSIEVQDSSNPANAFDIGLLVMGERSVLSRNFNMGWEVRRETLNQVLESDYGVITVGPNLYQRSRFVGSWKATSTAERDELDGFFSQLQREHSGLFFIPDPDDSYSFFGRLNTDHALMRKFNEITEISGLEFLEDSPGRSLFA
jgi:hypothetical protein